MWDGGITEHQDIFGGDGYVPCLDVVICTWVYTYVKTYQLVYFKYVQFLYVSYTPMKLYIKNT